MAEAGASAGGNAAGGTPAQPPGASKKRTWARKQVTEILNVRMQREEGQNEYNIWYHKYLGDKQQTRERATTRCNPKLDSGMTKGSLTNPNAYLCVHFARGCCVYGPECIYLHRLPTQDDERRIDPLHDIFGRERHGADRDDMGGVGTFNRDCRTLYVAGILVSKDIDLEEILARHFGEWGILEEVAVKRKFGCAFIRYKHRIYAEFAKIAMAEQSLDHGEQLNVRWAFDDPNPRVIQEVQENKELKMLEALEKKGYLDTVHLDYNVPQGYQPPAPKAPVAPPPGMRALPAPGDEQASKKQRLESGSATTATGDGTESADSAALAAGYAPHTWYPDTDAQYAAAQQQQMAMAAAYSGYGYSDPAAYAAAAAAAAADPNAAAQQAAWYQYQQAYGAWPTDSSYAYAYAGAANAAAAAPTVPTEIGAAASRDEADARINAIKAKTDAQKQEVERKQAVDRMNALLNRIDATNT